MDCIFCKIRDGEIPAPKLYEDKNCFVIADINPLAKKHYLLIPKNHYAVLEDANMRDQIKLGKSLMKIPGLKEKLGLNNGYRLIVNAGADAGQEVKHLHIHILGGEKLGWHK